MRRFWKLIPLTLCLCACFADISSRNEIKGNEDDEPAVVTFYNQKCAGCHGLDGEAKLNGAPNFNDAEFQKEHTDEDISKVIIDGKPPRMPSYRAKLTDDQIKELVTYIRTFAKKDEKSDKKAS